MKISETRLRNIIRESLRSVLLNERVTDLPGWKAKGWYGKGHNDKSYVSVKQIKKTEDGIRYLVSVNGAPFCISYLRHKSYSNKWTMGYEDKDFDYIVLAFGDRYLTPSRPMSGRDRIAFGNISVDELNVPNAIDALHKIPNMEWTDVSPRRASDITTNITIGFDRIDKFSSEDAPYIIKTFVQALIDKPVQKQEKYVIPDMFYDSDDEYYETENVKEAWQKALIFYDEWKKELELDHPREYGDVQECLDDYYEKYQKYMRDVEAMQAGDWEDEYQRWSYGDDDY